MFTVMSSCPYFYRIHFQNGSELSHTRGDSSQFWLLLSWITQAALPRLCTLPGWEGRLRPLPRSLQGLFSLRGANCFAVDPERSRSRTPSGSRKQYPLLSLGSCWMPGPAGHMARARSCLFLTPISVPPAKSTQRCLQLYHSPRHPEWVNVLIMSLSMVWVCFSLGSWVLERSTAIPMRPMHLSPLCGPLMSAHLAQPCTAGRDRVLLPNLPP